MRIILWVVAALGALAGGALLLLGVISASGAPQQAAVAAIACAVAVIPYVLARSWDELARQPAGGGARPAPEPTLVRPLHARDRTRMLQAAAASGVLGVFLVVCLALSQWWLEAGNSAMARQLGDVATLLGALFVVALLSTAVLAIVAHRRA